MSNKYKISVSKIAIFYITMYIYMRAILLIFIGEISTYILIFAMLMLWIQAVKYIDLKKYKFNIVGLWEVFAVFFMLHMQQYVDSSFSYTTLVTFGGIITAVALSYLRPRWKIYYISFSEVFLKLHIGATLFFSIFPSLYRRTILQLFSGTTKIVLEGQVDSGCVPGITSHYSMNGMYLAIATIIFGCKVLVERKTADNKVKWWFVLSLLALVVTGKRAHLVFAVFSLVFAYMLFSNDRQDSKFIKMVFGGMCILVLIAIGINYLPGLSITLSRFINISTSEDITNGRIYFYNFALQWFKDNPLFGIGWEGFRYRLNLTQGAYVGLYEYMNAHNVYLQVLCELGIVGLIIFVSKLIQDMYYLIKKYRIKYYTNSNEKTYMLVAFCMHMFFILYCLTGNPLYDIEFFMPYMISMAMLYHTVRTNPH